MLMFVLAVLLGVVCGSDLNQLSDEYRAGSELALQQINNHPGLQNHFLFFKSLTQSDIDVGFGSKFLFHQFLLKPTKCRKGMKNADQSKCTFRNDRPMINCVTCYKTFNGELEQNPKPYIHCVLKPTLTEEMKSQRKNHCEKMSYSSGSASVLTVRKPAEK